jgi:hypothetical protein
MAKTKYNSNISELLWKNKRHVFEEGDFSALSQWLGTDLDYNKIQNMLLGEP